MTESLITEARESAWIIRLNRPELRNPLSVEVLDALADLLNRAEVIPELKRIIFTGSGDVFASGADLREIAGLDPAAAHAFALHGQSLMAKIASLSIETVAAINGYCFGGALDLALSCKRRIASSSAKFAHPGAGLGIITGWGGTQRLPRLIGQTNSLMMFFTAAPINADEALRIGLVDEIAADPVETAMAF